MPDDIRRGEVIKTTVGEVVVELARRGLDPHSPVTVTIESGELAPGRLQAERESPSRLQHSPAEAAARIRELRKGNMLPAGVTIKDLINYGRA